MSNACCLMFIMSRVCRVQCLYVLCLVSSVCLSRAGYGSKEEKAVVLVSLKSSKVLIMIEL